MTINQKPHKISARAEALRNNLQKRKQQQKQRGPAADTTRDTDTAKKDK